jgi:hypothetical protein
MSLPLVNSAGPAPSIEQHYRWQDISRIVVLVRARSLFPQNETVAQPAA